MRIIFCVIIAALVCNSLSCSDPNTVDPNGSDDPSDTTGTLPNDSLAFKFYRLNEKGSDSPLYSIFMFNNRAGVVTTTGPRWLSTTDGGANWKNNFPTSGPLADFFCADFVDSANGVIGGGRSTSAGKDIGIFRKGKFHWDFILDGESASIRSISFSSHAVALAVDDGGGVHYTKDSCREWKSLRRGYTPLFGTAVQNKSTFWMVGWNGTILFTQDTCKTIVAVTSVTTKRALYSITFLPDGSTGWIVGDRTLLYTTDFGKTWTDVPTTADLRFVRAHGNKAYAVGLNGALLMTSDVKTWRSVSTGTKANLYGLDCRDSLWIVGDGGTILTTMPPK